MLCVGGGIAEPSGRIPKRADQEVCEAPHICRRIVMVGTPSEFLVDELWGSYAVPLGRIRLDGGLVEAVYEWVVRGIANCEIVLVEVQEQQPQVPQVN